MTRPFDCIVIGAGQAGPPLAGRLAGAGMTVAMIERKRFGGTCVNTGCMPTKALVASAYAAHVARRARTSASRSGQRRRRHEAASRRARTRSRPRRARCRSVAPQDGRCTVFQATPASSRRPRSGSAASCWRRRASSSTSAAAPSFRRCPASTTCRSRPTLDARARAVPGTWSSSAAATSAWSSRRCTGASERGDGGRERPAADPARGRGSVDAIREILERRRHRRCAPPPSASRSAKRGAGIVVGVECPRPAPRGRGLARAARRRPPPEHR